MVAWFIWWQRKIFSIIISYISCNWAFVFSDGCHCFKIRPVHAMLTDIIRSVGAAVAARFPPTFFTHFTVGRLSFFCIFASFPKSVFTEFWFYISFDPGHMNLDASETPEMSSVVILPSWATCHRYWSFSSRYKGVCQKSRHSRLQLYWIRFCLKLCILFS